MTINNSLTNKTAKPRFSVAIQSDAYKNLVNQTLGDPNKASRFIAAISSAVAINPLLQDCDAGTVLSAALLGESLNLSPSPALGHYYLVPFNDNTNNRKVATFNLGYRGFLQLAIRSGQYKKINVMAVKDGELVKYDPFSEVIELDMIEDEAKREKAKTTGYYAMFELTNGFTKTMYWSKEKMEVHAKTYSKAYGTKYSFWTKSEESFDQMAFKTMLRQLISKWGIMSIELKTAYESDMAAIKEDGTKQYVDNDNKTDFEPISEPIEIVKDE